MQRPYELFDFTQHRGVLRVTRLTEEAARRFAERFTWLAPERGVVYEVALVCGHSFPARHYSIPPDDKERCFDCEVEVIERFRPAWAIGDVELAAFCRPVCFVDARGNRWALVQPERCHIGEDRQVYGPEAPLT